jgi:hypothetical protein
MSKATQSKQVLLHTLHRSCIISDYPVQSPFILNFLTLLSNVRAYSPGSLQKHGEIFETLEDKRRIPCRFDLAVVLISGKKSRQSDSPFRLQEISPRHFRDSKLVLCLGTRGLHGCIHPTNVKPLLTYATSLLSLSDHNRRRLCQYVGALSPSIRTHRKFRIDSTSLKST